MGQPTGRLDAREPLLRRELRCVYSIKHPRQATEHSKREKRIKEHHIQTPAHPKRETRIKSIKKKRSINKEKTRASKVQARVREGLNPIFLLKISKKWRKTNKHASRAQSHARGRSAAMEILPSVLNHVCCGCACCCTHVPPIPPTHPQRMTLISCVAAGCAAAALAAADATIPPPNLRL